MVVTNKDKYNVKYKYPKGTSHSRAAIAKTTGISPGILAQVAKRGAGARKSNPQSVRSATTGKKIGGTSLRGKMSAAQWGQARIYSFVMKQKGTWSGADKDLADKVRKLKSK
tara:strand:- start:817 stop:1152 length:336 start_codon:yes stop_codon:yes gene_type:complete